MKIGIDVTCWCNRRGFGRFTRPKQVIQRCLSITSGNVLVFYKLSVRDGDYVMDDKATRGHFLFSDALIPERKSGHLYLPIDDRCGVPLYPLEPEKFPLRVKQVLKSIKYIAAMEDQRQRQEARGQADSGVKAEMQKFALVCAFGILLLIIIAIVVMTAL